MTLRFAVDVLLDGKSYPAARGALDERQIAITYVPKIKSRSISADGQAVLDPLEYTSFHRGAGASRDVGVPGMVAYTENAWTGDPGILMPGPEVTSFALTGATVAPRPDGVAEADGHIFVAAGRYVFKLANGQVLSPTPTQDQDVGAGDLAKAIKRFGSSLFMTETTGGGAVQNLWERPDGGAWTNTALGGSPVQPTGALGTVWWRTADGLTLERLVAQFGARGIRYCSAAPRLDTSWTPGLANPAIDVSGNIVRFATTLTHLYVATTSGLRDLDSSGIAPNMTPASEYEVLGTNGLVATAHDGSVYYSSGYDLFEVTVTGVQYATPRVVTPMAVLPNETPVAGYGTAMVARGSWLIEATYDPINDVTWVAWGRRANSGYGFDARSNVAELGTIVWNVAPIVLHGFKVTAMHITGLATDGPRLYMFGQTLAGAVSGKWAPLAYSTPYADLKSGRARRFAQTCFTILPSDDGGDDAVPKDIEEIQHEGENLVAGNSVTISAKKEDESAFTQLATFTSGPRIVKQVSTAYMTQRPTFKIEMTGTPQSPPITRRLSVRWLPNPDTREVRKYVFRLGRDESFASGNRVAEGAEEQVERLLALSNSAARVTFEDEAPYLARVLSLDGPTEVAGDTGDERVLAIGVTLSLFGRLPGAPFIWGSGATWGSGRSWG